ncbi:MAG: UDP-N-acetylglucosamine 2-epimerase (non-hydrolyzing) [Flavobacteriaceae bacterium]|nr:UDP-N-acetylglucosamine 2-epimerase (non-hydrolyzing) [Flavobacteriaceae bacterium]
MKKLKVITLVGTRPEIIKLSRVIAELDKYTDQVLVHSGQNYDYELNEVFFNDLEIRKPDYFLAAAGNSACETIANVIVKTEQVLLKEQPDAFLIYGDTNSCLGAIAAKRHQVPVFHMEAGNRSFDERVPEEINRRILDHISDINLPLTQHGRDYLVREGIQPETVIKTGSCLQEVLEYYHEGIEASRILTKLQLQKKNYFVVSLHREENVDVEKNLSEAIRSIDALATEFDKEVIVSLHPRTAKRIEALGKTFTSQNIKLIKPLGFFDYIKLQKDALCVISDSGTITEEAALLNFPAVTVRQSHERPEGMDAGTLIMVGYDADRLLSAVRVSLNRTSSASTISDYQGGAVSRKVLNIILSYTDYVRRTVWRCDV